MSMEDKDIHGGCATISYLFMWTYIIIYIINVIKFFRCDFIEPFRDEIIYGIGLFGFAPITVWM